MKNKMKKVLDVLGNVLMWSIIIVGACVTVVSLSTKERGIANIMGYIPFSIQTASMEPTINTGDLIITKKYDGSTVLEKGTIISFFSIEQEKLIVKTHRIDTVINRNGIISYVTKGDNNNSIDPTEVAPGDIVSVYAGTKCAVVGYVLTFLKSQIGFLIFVILPLFIFFIYQLYTFIVLIIDTKKEEAMKELKTLQAQVQTPIPATVGIPVQVAVPMQPSVQPQVQTSVVEPAQVQKQTQEQTQINQ